MAAPVAAPPSGVELQLGPAEVLLSLPAALGVGQMLIDGNLNSLPWVVTWTGAVVAYKAITAPGVGRGSLDWLVDSLNLGPELRARLGVPEELLQVAPRPRSRGAWGLLDGVVADVRNWRAAIDARRMVTLGGLPPLQSAGLVAALYRAPGAAHDAGDELDVAAVEALDDAGDDEPDIGLPAVRLEDIANLDNLWVVGPKGSGKTTLLQRLLELRRGKNWAVDPHATPSKWPRCVVVGGGLEFGAIDEQLNQFMGWLRQRYKAQATGEVTEAQCKKARRTLVGDEWRAIRKALPGLRATRDEPASPSAADRLLDIISQGRKAGICALVASHADTAEAMGVTGEKDILKCFDLVIYLGALATERVPSAARMRRPAVVFDPERNAWAQLLIGPALAPGPSGPARPTASPAVPQRALAGLVPCDACGQPTPRAGRFCIVCGGAQDSAGDTTARLTAPPAAYAPAGAAEPDPLFAGLLAGEHERPRIAGVPGEVVAVLSPERRERLRTIMASRQLPASSTSQAGPSVSNTPAAATVAPPVSNASGSQDTAPGVSVSVSKPEDTDTGHGGVSTAQITVEPAGTGGVTINVNASAAAAPRSAAPLGRGGLNVRRRRQRVTSSRKMGKQEEQAARYAARKAEGWSYRKAYAEIGGNSDDARAAWRAAPGPKK